NCLRMSLRLSVIDASWPGHLLDLVPQLDQLGYHRYWATEHHSEMQSASPTIITALAAGISDRMRVGSAGVLLNLYSPIKVAEDFRTLELFFPGRIDLGIARSTPPGRLGAALLEGRSPSRAEYAKKVRELARIVRYESGEPEEVEATSVGPHSDSVPSIWLCG